MPSRSPHEPFIIANEFIASIALGIIVIFNAKDAGRRLRGENIVAAKRRIGRS